ncbi:MAG TPA: M36 family metallopeptidase, partial [Saprospiraceae bacterium]|nr:M36 family metallopeptidase [Saprospiraceae bacterium]
IIDRGLCEFGTKALNAQNAGAIGCIICNFEEATISMGKGVDGGKVTIPVLSVKKSVCDKLKQYQGAGGLMITIQGPPDSLSGPALLDGSLDNGIMAHELGHGVSIRLTGGPANSGCLNNGEQMGEGWSDFLALVTTVKPGDTKDKPRGVGTYVTKENDNGKGFRTYQYSTDFSINPHTYGDIAGNTEVHYVGEVWNSMLWDLYWAFVDKYGLDPTYKDVNSGSYKAVRLVMDALKIQPCSPGFADGRDAILAADIINYNGENGCLIWDVFAKRGLGHLANQGNSNSAGDGKENFDIKPLCLNTITIKKEATPLIKAGEEIEYTITVSNYKSVPATGTVVTDQIPEGATVSNANGGTVTGDVISFDLGTLASNETKIITYSVSSSFKIWSQRQIF